ncbi:MAG: CpaF family protein [Rhodospirillales bacterium]|nr:CpaF family protein [Rhodospirillales bacterium]
MRLFSKGQVDAKQRLNDIRPVTVRAVERLENGVAREPDQRQQVMDLKVRMHQRLLEVINLAALDKMSHAEAEGEIGQVVRELLQEEKAALNAAERNQLASEIVDEVLGLGPLEPMMKDETVSDILVNTHKLVFVERYGKLQRVDLRFKDDRHLLRIINKIVSTVGRRVDESQPTVDARLLDGSRVNAVIPPIAVDGPLLSIRRFAKRPITIERMIELGTLTPEIAAILEGIVKARRNILISGGTGSGKTTMLNAMSGFIDEAERIITIEDAAELQLQQVHVARMETRPPNIEGKGEIVQRDLLKNALRMRPDRIIVGEVRAGEAFDMLQAMNTGHEGSMTTIHANSCRDSLSRLEQMIGMAGLDMPIRSMRAQIASAIHIVLQLERMSDGRRRLVSFQEITGMESDVITMQEIFRFNRRATEADGRIVGEFRATGIRPKFMPELERRGIHISAELFSPDKILG